MDPRWLSLMQSELVTGPLWMILGAILDEPLKKAYRKVYRKSAKMMRHVIPAREVPREMFFTPHDAKYGWVVLDTTNGRGYGKAQLVTRYINEDAQLPDVLKKLRSETAAEI